MATNTSSLQQKADFIEQDEEKVPESNGHDTGKNAANHTEYNIQYHDKLETIPEEECHDLKEILWVPNFYYICQMCYLRLGLRSSIFVHN